MSRLAVIGAGNHSASHHGAALRTYRAAHPDEIELAAVCDLDMDKARRYAGRFGFLKVYDDYDRMLGEERLDGLVAVTPIALTERIAGDLLTRGIPLVIEKPPGITSEGTRRLLHAARERNAPHMVSFNRRFNPALTKAREWLSGPGEGRPPQIILARMLRRARREADFAIGTGIHLIDAVLSFLGQPGRVVTRRIDTATPGCHLFASRLEFTGDAVADLVISPDVGTDEETYEIQGPGYCIQVDEMRSAIRVFDGGRETLSWAAPEGAEPAFTCGAVGETEAFVGYIRQGKGYWPDLEDGLLAMLTAEAVQAGNKSAFGA